jgi:hypothetical protein
MSYFPQVNVYSGFSDGVLKVISFSNGFPFLFGLMEVILRDELQTNYLLSLKLNLWVVGDEYIGVHSIVFVGVDSSELDSDSDRCFLLIAELSLSYYSDYPSILFKSIELCSYDTYKDSS